MHRLLGVALPSALLAVLITAACELGTPASPLESPNLEVTYNGLVCPADFTLQFRKIAGIPPDRNMDGAICFKVVAASETKKGKTIRIDNSVPGDIGGCPDGFLLTFTKDSPADRNGDFLICVKKLDSGETIEIDNTA